MALSALRQRSDNRQEWSFLIRLHFAPNLTYSVLYTLNSYSWKCTCELFTNVFLTSLSKLLFVTSILKVPDINFPNTYYVHSTEILITDLYMQRKKSHFFSLSVCITRIIDINKLHCICCYWRKSKCKAISLCICWSCLPFFVTEVKVNVKQSVYAFVGLVYHSLLLK